MKISLSAIPVFELLCQSFFSIFKILLVHRVADEMQRGCKESSHAPVAARSFYEGMGIRGHPGGIGNTTGTAARKVSAAAAPFRRVMSILSEKHFRFAGTFFSPLL